jgi:hypothetical protein
MAHCSRPAVERECMFACCDAVAVRTGIRFGHVGAGCGNEASSPICPR